MDKGLAISMLNEPAWRERLEELGRLDPAAVQLDDGPAWHEPMIREAEQNGNAFAAIWHLDRLIAARPDDWLLVARRARAWSCPTSSTRPPPITSRPSGWARGSRSWTSRPTAPANAPTAGRWAEALWYLDRLIAARPDDWTQLEERAAVYGKLGREADRQAELARVFELGADQGIVIPRAEELGRAGRWAEAAGLLARCGRTGPLSRELAQAWGIACLKAGDRAGYREACAASWRARPDPIVAWDATPQGRSWPWAPRAWTITGPDRLVRATAGRRSRATPIYRPYYFSNALGGLLIRAGRIDEAITRLNEGTPAATEAKFRNPHRLGLPRPGPRERETLPKPASGSTASAHFVLLRRSPSGTSRSWLSSGARPSRCSSMLRFRAIRFRLGGRDEPLRLASFTVPMGSVTLVHARGSRRSCQRGPVTGKDRDQCRSRNRSNMTCWIDWPRNSPIASGAANVPRSRNTPIAARSWPMTSASCSRRWSRSSRPTICGKATRRRSGIPGPRVHPRARSATTGFSARSAGAGWGLCTRPSRSRWAAAWR